MQSLSFKSGDVLLHADRLGSGHGALLLHAGGERRSVWHPVMEKLAAAGFSAMAVDQRGHGESGGERADGVRMFGRDARAALREMPDWPILVGSSLGGFAALLALADDAVQQDAAGLVLVDVTPDPEPKRTRAFLAATTQPDLAENPLVEDILGRADELRAAAAAMRLPVLLVRAGQGAVTEGEVESLRTLIPHLETATVPDAGHLVARDAPEALAAILVDFLSRRAVRERGRHRDRR
jgi:pimeloyl-ACP methyl ester carboxylesterase